MVLTSHGLYFPADGALRLRLVGKFPVSIQNLWQALQQFKRKKEELVMRKMEGNMHIQRYTALIRHSTEEVALPQRELSK